MKTIGLIGGLSWESSQEYYRLINQAVQASLGGTHSAKIVMHSFDFAEIAALQHDGAWAELTERMTQAARNMKAIGADFGIIASNTMHKVADQVEADSGLPFLHIVDPTGYALAEHGISKVGLLGTEFTMSQGFYRDRLTENFGIDVITPGDAQRRIVHDTIYGELVKGTINPASRAQFSTIMTDLADRGAEAIVLGCTEIMLLVQPEDAPVPLFDTTTLHARQAARESLHS